MAADPQPTAVLHIVFARPPERETDHEASKLFPPSRTGSTVRGPAGCFSARSCWNGRFVRSVGERTSAIIFATLKNIDLTRRRDRRSSDCVAVHTASRPATVPGGVHVILSQTHTRPRRSAAITLSGPVYSIRAVIGRRRCRQTPARMSARPIRHRPPPLGDDVVEQRHRLAPSCLCAAAPAAQRGARKRVLFPPVPYCNGGRTAADSVGDQATCSKRRITSR